jgi:hypothetical protein
MEGNLTESLSSIACDIHVHYTTYLMVAMVVLSWFTRELLVFFLSMAIQLQTVFILALSAYIGRCSVDRLCPTSDDNCYSWPSNEMAQLGTLIGTVITYNTLWEQWHCGTATKVGGTLLMVAAGFVMIITGMTNPGAGVVGFVIGFFMSIILVAGTRQLVYRMHDTSEYTGLLHCTMCEDRLVGNKQCILNSNVVNEL